MLYHPEMLVRFTGSGRPAGSNEFLGSLLFEAREREEEPKKLHVMKQTQCNNFPWKNNIFSADTDVCSCYYCCYIRCCLLYSSFMDHDKNDYSSNRTKRICRILVTSMTAGLSASQPACLP